MSARFQRVKEIISEFNSFEINLCGLGIFPTGIYARVDDGGKFKAINERLSEELRGQVDASVYDAESYVPHVTLASFNTKDVTRLVDKVNSTSMNKYEFGQAGVFEIESVRTNLILALGPEETQDRRTLTFVHSGWVNSRTSQVVHGFQSSRENLQYLEESKSEEYLSTKVLLLSFHSKFGC